MEGHPRPGCCFTANKSNMLERRAQLWAICHLQDKKDGVWLTPDFKWSSSPPRGQEPHSAVLKLSPQQFAVLSAHPQKCFTDCKENTCTVSLCIMPIQLDDKFMAPETADGCKMMTWPLKRMVRTNSMERSAPAVCHLRIYITLLTTSTLQIHELSDKARSRIPLALHFLAQTDSHADAMPARQPV